MNTPMPGHRAPSASFEVPLEMLAACHLRIESQCDTLQRLAEHLLQHGCDEQARSAAAGVMRYFDTAALQHHADEESDLFPALLESMAGSDAVCLRELTQSLTQDHRALTLQWRALRTPLSRLAEGGEAVLPEDAVRAFADAYRAHLEREDGELLPMATRLLDDSALEQIGRAMRERRGIAPPDTTDLPG
ncbi:MAG: hemerythrin domain-containing protein [Rubrivivax sp.]